MTEKQYDALWQFAHEHRDHKSTNPCEPQVIAILRLYQEQSTVPIMFTLADEIEECTNCIRMALRYAFTPEPTPRNA